MMASATCIRSMAPKLASRRIAVLVNDSAKRKGRRFFSSPQQKQRPLSTMPQLQEREESVQSTWFHGSNHHDNASRLESATPFRQYAAQSPQFKYPKEQQQQVAMANMSLGEFIDLVPLALRARQDQILAKGENSVEAAQDPVMALFRQLELQPQDWAPYAHFDPSRAYTRNLIATDDESFTLLLLCWNPARESKVHDHPCHGCWLNVLQGQVQECRYEYPTDKGRHSASDQQDYLQCIADETFTEGQIAFINDSIGLHKVGNPSDDIPAVTLHLYAPPFQECRVWVQDDNDDAYVAKSSDCATYFSEYGRVL